MGRASTNHQRCMLLSSRSLSFPLRLLENDLCFIIDLQTSEPQHRVLWIRLHQPCFHSRKGVLGHHAPPYLVRGTHFHCLRLRYDPLPLPLPSLYPVCFFTYYPLVVFVSVCTRRTSATFEAGIWKHRCYFAFLFVMNALYFPLISRIFSAFKCDTDPITHK